MRKSKLLAIGAAAVAATTVGLALTMSSGFAGLRHGPEADQEETEQLVARPYTTTGSCGVERWSVKTGTDADNGLINLNSTTSTTIAALDAMPAPSNLPANNRVQPTETTVYQINATLTEYKLEADSDYHLVMSDGAGNTMIGEIPDPACVGAGSPLLSGIQKARGEFDAKYTPTGSFKSANVPVILTGVGFFDFLHGQTGVAPNGIELHAVLDVNFGGPTTTTKPPPTTTPPPTSPSVTNPGNQTGTAGTATSLQLSASGGTPPYSWSATGLPPGLTVNTSTGQITGTPTTAGSYSVTATATDSVTASGSTTFNWTINPSGTCTAGQLLANPGFESGAAAWTATSGVIGQNAPAEPAHTGTWNAWLDGYGSTHTDTLTQAVTIPSGCVNDTLSFWLHIDTSEPLNTAYDTVTVQLLDSSGAVLTTLATFSNKDAAAGYTQHSYQVGAYAGRAVTVKFIGAEDYTRQTSFVLDDTALNVS